MKRRSASNQGFTLLEVLIAVLVLAFGLLACTTSLVVGMANNTRNQNDSGGTLLAQMVIEQINTLAANGGSISMTDCNGTIWTVKTDAAAQPSGAGAAKEPTFGGIDFTEVKTSIPSGYQMDYVMCASQQSRRATYDVRWNVSRLTASTNLITVAARQTATANGARIIYSPPVTLRTIQGAQ